MRTATLLVALALIGGQARAQIRAGCTADSASVIKAGTLAATELVRYSCYAQNIGPQTQTLSRTGFALDFLELRQLDLADVADVFAQKQGMTKTAKAVRVLEYAAAGAAFITGQGYVAVTVRVASAAGLVAYGASKLGDQLAKEVPPTANALSGMLAQDVVLAPGQGYSWKVYASKGSKAVIGPRMLSTFPIPAGMVIQTPMPAVAQPAPTAQPAGQHDSAALPWLTCAELCGLAG
jgi:hypothetical protein